MHILFLMETPVVTKRESGAVIVVLNRSEKANAYDRALIDALRETVSTLAFDDDARVVIISGEGKHFCAGADLGEMREKRAVDAMNLESAHLFDAIAHLRQPTIAAIRGAALGGGLELALACDLRVATEDAFFGFPETSLGLIPAAGGTLRLPQTIGVARAKELIFTARRIDAATALRFGLVNEVVPNDALQARVVEIAAEISRNDALALQLAKQALQTDVIAFAQTAQATLYHRRANGMPANA